MHGPRVPFESRPDQVRLDSDRSRHGLLANVSDRAHRRGSAREALPNELGHGGPALIRSTVEVGLGRAEALPSADRHELVEAAEPGNLGRGGVPQPVRTNDDLEAGLTRPVCQ